jgi:hypothetical protein
MATENTARLAVLIDADNAQASITEALQAFDLPDGQLAALGGPPGRARPRR